MDCSPLGFSVHGISQIRSEWVATFFSRASSWPRDWNRISCIGRETLCLLEWLQKTWQYQIPAVPYQVKFFIWPSNPILRSVFTPKKWRLLCLNVYGDCLFVIAKSQKQPKISLPGEWIHELYEGLEVSGKKWWTTFTQNSMWIHCECTRLRESLEGGVMESFGAVGLPCILVLVVIWTPFIETLYFTIWKLIKGSNYWRPSN